MGGPATGAATIALVPVTATLLAIPVLGEIPTLIDGFAIGVIAIGVFFATRPQPSFAPTQDRNIQ